MTRGLVATFFGLLLGSTAMANSAEIDLSANIIAYFHIAHPDEMRFGDLTWNGGLELESSNRALGGLSGLVVDPGGAGFIAVADDGHLFRASIERDADGRPTAMTNGEFRDIGPIGNQLKFRDWEADTESVDIWPGDGGQQVAISFEGRPRVIVGDMGADGFPINLQDRKLPKSIFAVRDTKGLETLAAVPGSEGRVASLLVIAERPEHGAKVPDRPAWILGPSPMRFRVKAVGDYDITDAKYGPGGDLFILERLYSLAEGVKMRIRRISAADIMEGETVDGHVVIEANLANQIDNMEGLSIWTDPKGRTIFSLISDDNRSFLQRTLYLEFVYQP